MKTMMENIKKELSLLNKQTPNLKLMLNIKETVIINACQEEFRKIYKLLKCLAKKRF